MQVHEGCDVGVIGLVKDLEGVEIDAVCEQYPLAPCFEGRQNESSRTTPLG